MKYTVTIVSRLLAAAAAVLLVVLGLAPQDTATGILFAAMCALGILAMIQLFKSTPRVLLMFCGLGVSLSMGIITQSWLPALLAIGAAALPTVYVLAGWARQVKAEPLKPERNTMLIVAGVMASVYLVYQVAAGVLTTHSAADWLGSGLAGTAGFTVFCFLSRRRTSVFYRMLFYGMSSGQGFSLPDTGMAVKLMGWLAASMVMLAALLVLADAVRTRRELTGIQDKRESDKVIVVYVLTALLSLLAEWMIYTPVPLLFDSSGYSAVFLLLLFILSIVQFFKATPRLLMMTAGTVMLLSLGNLFSGDFTSLLPLAAGALPAVYLLIRFSRQVRSARPERRGLLVAAGVLAGVCAVVLLLAAVVSFGYAGSGSSLLVQALFAAGLAVFCLVKTRPDGVLYRLMLAGWPWMLPALVGSLGTVADYSGGLLAMSALLVLIACLMLVYGDAIKTRGELESAGMAEDVAAASSTAQ